MAASRVACASFTIGTNTTITITRDNSSYTHTITWKFGSASGTIATKTTETSIVWTPTAATLYAQIPNTINGYGTITCQTYNGNSLVGTTTAEFYAYVDKESNKPNFSVDVADTESKTIAVTGNNKTLVCYLSKPKVTVNASGVNGATIKSVQIYNPVGLYADKTPYTFDTVYDQRFKITVIDSRGLKREEYVLASKFIEYAPAYIDSVVLKRSESTSTTGVVTLKGYCFKGNFGAADNTLTVKYRFKTTGSYGNYATISNPTWSTDGTFSLTANIPNLSLEEHYTFEFVISDKLTEFVSEEVVLSKQTGDLRIGKEYVQAKNNLITGDKNNEAWRCFKARRKRDGINYDANFGAGFGGGGISAVMEVNQVVDGVETKLARYDLMKDGFLHNWFTNMSVAEILSYAPSIVAGGPQGKLLLNGGDSDPILIQWGRVSLTPTAANTVTKLPINFIWGYQGIPAVFTEMSSSAPATIDIAAGDITTTGFNLYLQRTNTTATSIMWWAIGNGTPSMPE